MYKQSYKLIIHLTHRHRHSFTSALHQIYSHSAADSTRTHQKPAHNPTRTANLLVGPDGVYLVSRCIEARRRDPHLDLTTRGPELGSGMERGGIDVGRGRVVLGARIWLWRCMTVRAPAEKSRAEADVSSPISSGFTAPRAQFDSGAPGPGSNGFLPRFPNPLHRRGPQPMN